MKKKLAIVFGLLFVLGTFTSCDFDKVKVCHKGKWIEVSVNAAEAHYNHGDTVILPAF